MKKKLNKLLNVTNVLLIVAIVLMLPCQQLSAQNRKGGGGGKSGGGNAARSKPAANKPGGNNRPGGNNAGARNKPSANNKPGGNIASDRNKPGGNIGGDRKNNVNNSGNKTNNIGSNNKKVNIDNSKKNVNVNVNNSKNVHLNNSRNTAVRRNSRPYSRPPYRYGGRSYRCYHPYYFHPYRPFIWGPRWHPWGFFVATLATTAIILIVDNDMPGDLNMATTPVFDNSYYWAKAQPALSGASYASFSSYSENQAYSNDHSGNTVWALADEYYYDEGVYYLKGDDGYTVVSAPIGAKIKTLPTGYQTVSVDDNTKNYYYGGTFYEKTSAGYTVVAPTAGTVVSNVSEGGEEVKMGDVTYVKVGETYFQPIQQDGKDMYEVADIEEDK